MSEVIVIVYLDYTSAGNGSGVQKSNLYDTACGNTVTKEQGNKIFKYRS
jgi:hypothetical protein